MSDDKHFVTNYWEEWKKKAAVRQQTASEAYQKELGEVAKTFDNDLLRMAEEIVVLRIRLKYAIQDKARE